MTPGEIGEIVKFLTETHALTTPSEWKVASDGSHIYQTRHFTRDVWTIPHSVADLPWIVAAHDNWPTISAHFEKQKELIAQWQARYDQLKQLHRRLTDEEFEEVKAIGEQINKALNAEG